MSDDPRLTYAKALTRAADDLDDELARVRAATDAGQLTPVQAAAERVEALEAHLARVKAIREENTP